MDGISSAPVSAGSKHPAALTPATGATLLCMFEAQRLAHALNGALLDAASAAGGLAIVVGGNAGCGSAHGVWTAVLRSDLDGPGGMFVMVAPAAMARGMPEADLPGPRRGAWDPAASGVSAAFADIAAAGLAAAVRTSESEMALLDGPVSGFAPGILVHPSPGLRTRLTMAHMLS